MMKRLFAIALACLIASPVWGQPGGAQPYGPGWVQNPIGVFLDQGGATYNIKSFGAKCDGRIVLSASQGGAGITITNGSTTAVVGSGQFTSADVGKAIVIGAFSFGANPFSTTVASITDATHIVLAAAPSASLTTAEYVYGTDDTAAFAAATTFSNAYGSYPHGVNFVVGPGNCLLSTMQLGVGQTWQGSGDQTTTLTAIGSSQGGFISLPQGPVTNIHFNDFFLQGAGNVNLRQNAIYLYAQASAGSPFNGGPWFMTMQHVTVRNFDGNGLVLRGDPSTNYLLPVQFLYVNDYNCDHSSSSYSHCLLATGQVQHVQFDSSRFDGPVLGTGVNIEMSREFVNGGVYGGVLEGGSAVGPNGPGAAITFNNMTCQTASTCFYADSTANVLMNGAYFEALYYGINAQTTSYNILCTDCNFQNSASDGSGGGYYVKAGTNSSVELKSPLLNSSTTDKIYIDSNGSAGIKVTNPTFGGDVRTSNTTDGKTTATTKQVGVTNNSGTGVLIISAYTNARQFIVNTSALPVAIIDAMALPGEIIYLTSFSGPVTYTTFSAIGSQNIILSGGATSVVVPQNETIAFIKSDLGVTSWLQVGLNSGGQITGVPTISSGFGTSPSVVNGYDTQGFTLNVGTGGTASSGVIAMNSTAAHGWGCTINNLSSTSAAVSYTKVTGTSTTTVTIGNFSDVSAPGPWNAGDVLQLKCWSV